MKKLIIFISIFSFLSGHGQEEQFYAGNQAYEKEDYQTAIEEYNKVIALGYYSSELYYNLGNAYYRNGEIGKSIWSYEVAMKVDPKNADAKSNLQFVNAHTIDKIDSHRPGLGSWLMALLFGPMINVWAWMSIGSCVLLSFSLIIFFRSRNKRGRNISMFVGTIAGLLLIFSIFTAHFHKASIMDKTEAIVVNRKTEVKISPLESATKSFELNEGTKVQLVDKNDNWTQIEVNGNVGWVENNSIWEI